MMIKKFNCLQCNYQTDLPSNFKRHTQTTRHQNNLKNYSKNSENPPLSSYIHHDETQTENTLLNSKIIKCDHCETIYSTQYNLNRHLTKCTKKTIEEKNKKIQELIDEHFNYRLEIEEKNKKIQKLNAEILNYKLDIDELKTDNKKITNTALKIAENQSANSKKQITNTQYIINNYKDAPNLEFPLVNWSNETMDYYVNLGPVKGLSKIITDHWVDNIPPESRSIWNIDYARNKFIIRKDDSWIVDINGATFQEITIAKIYEHFMDYMKNSERKASEMVDLMSFMCDIRNKDMGLKALKDAGKYLIYDNEKYKDEPPLSF